MSLKLPARGFDWEADADGWIHAPWVEIAPGHPLKVYSEENAGEFIVGHSIVGSYQAAISRFLSDDRVPGNPTRFTDYAAASVMWIVPYQGPALQLYPVTASTWASGTWYANTRGWSIELEGGAPGNEREPINGHQMGLVDRIADVFETVTGRTVRPGVTFREHNEFAATACPSSRYDRWYDHWRKRVALIDDLAAILVGNGIDAYNRPNTTDLFPPGTPVVAEGATAPPGLKPVRLTGAAAIEYAKRRGFSFALGLGNAQASIADLAGRVATLEQRSRATPAGPFDPDDVLGEVADALQHAADELRGNGE